ncbi:hypothetical protein KSS87_019994 [Heliosperma pusillum]|nr:hypothetical protein KSS87_019994 [Heliosperma pusillum]
MVVPPMKLGKHLEDPISGSCRESRDMISILPDELLGHLLSFLPTRCAVSTSILSKRWRYLFSLMTCLCFDDLPCFGHPIYNVRIESTKRFKEFVDKVLELHQISPIKKFSLLCRAAYDNSDLNRWLSYALQKGVQELHCNLANGMNCMLDGVFVCKTLVSLKLTPPSLKKIQIPLSACLPKLKILHLELIIFFDCNAMERLFAGCEKLEELILKSCVCYEDGHLIHRTETLKELTLEFCSFPFGTFGIDAPNLACLTYDTNRGVKIVPSWKNSCFLYNAKLVFRCSANDSIAEDRELLKDAACRATVIRFKRDSIKYLLTLDDDEQMPYFLNLSILHIHKCPYDAWKYVTSVIGRSPQLKTVIFNKGISCRHYSGCRCQDDGSSVSLSPSDILLDPFSCHVQNIEVRHFCRHKGSLSLMGHLLRNASALKRVIVYTLSRDPTTCSMHSQNQLLKALSMRAKTELESRRYSIDDLLEYEHQLLKAAAYEATVFRLTVDAAEVTTKPFSFLCTVTENVILCWCQKNTEGHHILITVTPNNHCHADVWSIQFRSLSSGRLQYQYWCETVRSWKDSCSLVEAELKLNYNAEDILLTIHSSMTANDVLKAAAYEATVFGPTIDAAEAWPINYYLTLAYSNHYIVSPFHFNLGLAQIQQNKEKRSGLHLGVSFGRGHEKTRGAPQFLGFFGSSQKGRREKTEKEEQRGGREKRREQKREDGESRSSSRLE